ncbi:MAG: hypothetical protein ACRCVT_06315 [Leadbetterella sp.]
MSHSTLPAWLKITVFLLILSILGYFGDVFTFVVGTIIMILIFANGYDKENAEHH